MATVGEKVEITKDMTLILKGFAILFMIAHHVLIKEFYIEPPIFLSSFIAFCLQIGMKMCVGIFTFFVGYGYFYSKNKDTKYAIQHFWRMIKMYWLILIPTILLAVWGGYELNAYNLLYNVVGLKAQYNLGNWYVYFYLFALCILPLVNMILQKRIWTLVAAMIVVAGILWSIISSNDFVSTAIKNCLIYFQVLVVGFACAKTQILSRMSLRISSVIVWFVLAILAVILRCGFSMICGLSTDIILIPIFVISISALFQTCNSSMVKTVLSALGASSTLMWFIHAIPFSDGTRVLFQNSPVWVNSVLAQFIIVTMLSYMVTRYVQIGINKIESVKSK